MLQILKFDTHKVAFNNDDLWFYFPKDVNELYGLICIIMNKFLESY